jgi:(p)ppGpp synthase/HD superfamily hydrolase
MYPKSQHVLAFEIAKTAHDDQFRKKSNTPYFEHPKRVANYVQARFFPQEEGLLSKEAILCISAAYLHDVLEDTTETELTLLEKGVSPEIIEIVKILTKQENIPYDEYLQKVKKHKFARMIKIADILDNLSDAPSPRQIQKYALALQILHA